MCEVLEHHNEMENVYQMSVIKSKKTDHTEYLSIHKRGHYTVFDAD